MPKIIFEDIPQINTTGYPPEYADKVQGRWYRRIAPAAGISDFGISHVTLLPGAWSSQRHWHEGEDEFIVMILGEAVMIDDGGETIMRAGDCAAFPKRDGNGHVLINRSNADCVFMAFGKPSASGCHYPDIDMHLFEGQGFRRKDGGAF